ncbi:MAG: M48 family metalloprotease [Erythrobacter sp.]
MTRWKSIAFTELSTLTALLSAAITQLILPSYAGAHDKVITPLEVNRNKDSGTYSSSKSLDTCINRKIVVVSQTSIDTDDATCQIEPYPLHLSIASTGVFEYVISAQTLTSYFALNKESNAVDPVDHRHIQDLANNDTKGAPAAPSQQPVTALKKSESSEERLYRIAYELGVANGDICDNPQMASGLKIHDIAAYEASYRAAAEKKFNLGHSFGIRYVIPNSVAYFSGLREGDVIHHINGFKVSDLFLERIQPQVASSDRVEGFEEWLGKALKIGPVEVRFSREGQAMTTILAGKPFCGGQPVFYQTGGFNAWADGHRVAATDEIVKFTESDDELAFVVAHEMSHNILAHVSEKKGKFSLLASLGIGSKKTKQHEIDADTLGTKMLLRAGYSHEGALDFLGRARRRIAFNISTTHPGISRRLNIVTETAQEAKE